MTVLLGPADADLYADPPADYDGPAEDVHPDDPDHLLQADRHLRALARLADREQEVSAVFRATIDRLEERLGEQLAIIERQREWHQRPLVQLHEMLLADNPTRKTLVLPNGELKATVPTKPQYSIVDAQAFLEWAHSSGRDDLINVTERPAKDVLNKAADIGPVGSPSAPGEELPVHDGQGERIPGVVAYLPAPRFRIVLAEEPGVHALDL